MCIGITCCWKHFVSPSRRLGHIWYEAHLIVLFIRLTGIPGDMLALCFP